MNGSTIARASGVAVILMALVVGAALTDAGRTAAARAQGGELLIYSSLPLRGVSSSEAVVRGERIALEEVGSRVGSYSVRLVSLDDSTASNPGTADAAATARNARRAADDPLAVFYLGEFNSGGTKVSLPILNAAGLAQVSPSNTYLGLTSGGPGTEPGEPQRYYPSGARTYARIVPNDKVQGFALATLMRKDRCVTVTLWNDRSVYGRGLAANIKRGASKLGLKVRNERGTVATARSYRALAARARSDCFVWAGTTQSNAVRVYEDVARALPKARLYGPDGLAEEAFTNPRRGGVPATVGRRIKLTAATLDLRSIPRAEAFVRAYERKYSTSRVDPYAVYGYETMTLALDALTRAGADANRRDVVVRALFATTNRRGVLGDFSIDPNGDTTLRAYGVYVIRRGLPRFSRKIVATPE